VAGDKEVGRIKKFLLVLGLFWVLIGVLTGSWVAFRSYAEMKNVAKVMGRAGFRRDVVYRHWNASHGGVYVPITAQILPNPYLEVPNRDLTTSNGVRLTLVNPAYMTRLAHEIGEERYDLMGHITSLRPIRPENNPDPWEVLALNAFETGESEYGDFSWLNGKRYYRYMAPLITEKGCLKCHAKQGYEVGDVRGGISVSVPMDSLWTLMWGRIKRYVLVGSMFLLFGVFIVLMGGHRLILEVLKRKKTNQELQEMSRKAGVAQVSTSILHNVGNAVNSINVSADLLATQLKTTKSGDVERIAALLEKEKENLPTFLESDSSGKHLIPYLSELGTLLNKEKVAFQAELKIISSKLAHLNETIRHQQDAAKLAVNICETIDFQSVFSDSALIHLDSLEHHGILFQVEGSSQKSAWADRHQVMHILGNILKNAKESILERNDPSERWIRVSIHESENDFLTIDVMDSGVGIREEDLGRVFQFGFTTKAEGHGFGLHGCAQSAKNMGGSLSVSSDGEGKGATFTLTLPCSKPQR